MAPVTGSVLRQNVNYVWQQHFSSHCKTASIKMPKNSYQGDVKFVMPNLVSQKFWMLAWKKRAFDAILGVDTDGLQNLDQDLYRQITSYAWSEMNEQLCQSLEDDFNFVGNEVTEADDGSGVPVKTPRKKVALEKLGNSIEKKGSEIVSEAQFKAYFLSGDFLKKRAEWAARVAKLRAAKEAPVVVQGVAVEHAQPSRVDTLAHAASSAATSAATSAVASATAHDQRVDVSVTVSVASMPRFTAPPPPPSPAPVSESAPESAPEPAPPPAPPPALPPPPAPPASPHLVARGSRMAVRSAPILVTSAAPPVAPPVQAVPEQANDEDIDCEMLEREFSETAIWSRSNVDEDTLEATRIVVSGFRFYSKYRCTPSAKTKGQRDSYCSISKGSRAERLAFAAGLPLKKTSDRTLRSKKDIQRFWDKIAAAGVQANLVK
jgi:hypothetical protein